jgi:leader peptidase (prepilin peptidase)/N-methyltransferase
MMDLTTSPWFFVVSTYLLAGTIGGCLGSFANVLIYRLPRDLNISHPRSFCPECETQIRWFDNVPVIGWLVLRGRCRQCRTAISAQYPLVELLGVVCGLVTVWRFGPNWAGLTAFLFLINLLVVARIDWEHMIIPHTLTLGGSLLGLALAPLNGLGLGNALLGGAIGAGGVGILAYGYKLLRGQLGMGGGDVMLMGMVGTYLGVLGVGLVIFGGALLGSLYALTRYRQGLDGSQKLPFGTFLAAAGVVAMLAGDSVVRWYLSFLV